MKRKTIEEVFRSNSPYFSFIEGGGYSRVYQVEYEGKGRAIYFDANPTNGSAISIEGPSDVVVAQVETKIEFTIPGTGFKQTISLDGKPYQENGASNVGT